MFEYSGKNKAHQKRELIVTGYAEYSENLEYHDLEVRFELRDLDTNTMRSIHLDADTAEELAVRILYWLKNPTDPETGEVNEL